MEYVAQKVVSSALSQTLTCEPEVRLLGSLWLAVGQLNKRASEGVTQNVCDLMTIEQAFFFIQLKHVFNAFPELHTVGDKDCQDPALEGSPLDAVRTEGVG